MTDVPHHVQGRPVELSPAAEFDVAALARVFTAGYEGYWFPVELDAAAFARMATVVDAVRTTRNDGIHTTIATGGRLHARLLDAVAPPAAPLSTV